MSTVATVYLCEEEAAEELLAMFTRPSKVEPRRLKALQLFREAHRATSHLDYPLLVVEGLSELLASRYSDADPWVLLRESLRKVSRDALIIITVKELKWSPTKQGEVQIDGNRVNVSEIDLETTLNLQAEHLGTGQGRKKRRDNFVIARL